MSEPKRTERRSGSTRRQFQSVLAWQARGTRVLAVAAVAVIAIGAAVWLIRGTGNLMIGLLLLVFAPILLVSVLLFLQVLRTIGGEDARR